eukprot:1829630-Alexandrium_andersonii.AAC.1
MHSLLSSAGRTQRSDGETARRAAEATRALPAPPLREGPATTQKQRSSILREIGKKRHGFV